MANSRTLALEGHAPPRQAVDDAAVPAPRAARAGALGFDVSVLLIAEGVALAAAVVYLLLRTSWGAVDAGAGDTAIAASLLLAVPPAWSAWLLAGVVVEGATPGQQRRGIAIARRTGSWRHARLLRSALHPSSVPAWVVLGALLWLAGLVPLGWLLLGWSALVLGAAVVSFLILAVAPQRRALHDAVARTRPVRVR